MEQVRHKPASRLERNRGLVLVCPEFRSSVNLSRIVRAAGCFGIREIIASGNTKIDHSIARDSLEFVTIKRPRTLQPVLKKLLKDGYHLVGLEQTDQSKRLYEFQFPWKTALVIGHERTGIDDEILALLHDAIEIPVYGQPHSFNAATASVIAMYEYCRQFPSG